MIKRGMLKQGIRALFGVWGVIILSSSPAQAAELCKREPLSATGKPSKIGELARGNAFFTWESLAKEKVGAAHMGWANATERKLSCIELMSGPDKGKWECTRTARPCKARIEAPVKASNSNHKTDKNTVKNAQSDAGALSNDDTCQSAPVSAYGKLQQSSWRAKNEAKSGWSKLVGRKNGQVYGAWAKAKQQNISCKKKLGGQFQCIASAIPCRS